MIHLKEIFKISGSDHEDKYEHKHKYKVQIHKYLKFPMAGKG